MGNLFLTPLKQVASANILPTAIPNLRIWLDPTDNATITQSGGKASQINDKSGNAVNFTQATGTKQPSVTAAAINGLQAFTFATANGQGMDGLMASSISTSNWTMGALVYSTTNTHFNGIIVDYVNNSDTSMDIGNANNLAAYVVLGAETAAGTSNSLPINTTFWCVLTCNPAGSITITNYVNNVSKGSNTQGSTMRSINQHVGWGNNTAWGQGFQGILGDMVIYDRMLTSTELGSLYNNFAKPKWGLP